MLLEQLVTTVGNMNAQMSSIPAKVAKCVKSEVSEATEQIINAFWSEDKKKEIAVAVADIVVEGDTMVNKIETVLDSKNAVFVKEYEDKLAALEAKCNDKLKKLDDLARRDNQKIKDNTVLKVISENFAKQQQPVVSLRHLR